MIKQLIFFVDSRDNYSGEDYEENVRDLVSQLVDFNKQVYFKCLWGNDHIPTLDIDNEEHYVLAKAILESNQVPFVTIQSSPNRFWILIDRLENHFDYAADIISGLPCDQKYVDLCKMRKRYSLRAGIKNGHIPRVLRPKGNNFSKDFMDFIDAVNNYFSSDYAAMLRTFDVLEKAKTKAKNSAWPCPQVPSVFSTSMTQEKPEETWDII